MWQVLCLSSLSFQNTVKNSSWRLLLLADAGHSSISYFSCLYIVACLFGKGSSAEGSLWKCFRGKFWSGH